MSDLSFAGFCEEVGKHLGVNARYATELTRAVVRVLVARIAAGDAVRIPGLGTFGNKPAGQYSGRLPSGKPCRKARRRVPRFRAAEELRRKVAALPV